MSEEAKLWERKEDESDAAWAAFVIYRDMPPSERSYDAAYRKRYVKEPHIRATKTFRAWAKKHDWRNRVEAWDRHLDDIGRAAAEEEKREWRKNRRDMLMDFGGKVADALNKFDPKDAAVSLNQITRAVEMLIQEMRAEMDDLPTERRDVTTGGQPLPPSTATVIVIPDNEREDRTPTGTPDCLSSEPG